MNTSLEKLRNELNDDQRKLINSFWKHFLDTGFWPLRMDIHQKYTKKKTMDVLRSVGGNPAYAGHIVYEDQAQNGPIYILSLIGILLTKDGEQYESWLVRLLEFFRKIFYQKKKDGKTLEYDKVQIGQALKLNDDKLRVLGEVARFAPFSTSHGHTIGHDWKISRPYNIDDFPPNGSLNAFFDHEIFKYFKHEKWVFQDDPHRRHNAFAPQAVFGNELVTPFQGPPADKDAQNFESVKIFISHSSQDKKLMEALVDLLKAAFALRTKDILCTSVAGHKLPGGADTEDAVLGRLKNAKLLIGVLTPTSLRSSYVLFELGARWGVGQPLISIVACGAKMKDLQEPLKSKNALDATDESDLHQLIEDVKKHLGVESEPASSFNSKIQQIVLMANQSASPE